MNPELVSSFVKSIVNPEYTLLDRGDVNANVKMIGDRIVEKIKNEYINNNPHNTPQKIEAQVKSDLLKIYYTDSGNRVVRPSMVKHFCNTWYNALRIRNETIIKELVKYMKTHEDQNPVQKTGNQEEKAINNKPEDKERDDNTADSKETAEDIHINDNKIQQKNIESIFGLAIEKDEENADDPYAGNKMYGIDNDSYQESKQTAPIRRFAPKADDDFKGGNGGLENLVKSVETEGLGDLKKVANEGSGNLGPLGSDAPGTAVPSGDTSAETEKKNSILLNKLIEYKVKLFKSENFEKSKPLKRSATVSQVYDLHEKLITKILCNYAAIDRSLLMGELRKIILGEDVMKEIEDFNRKRRWVKTKPKEGEPISDSPRSIYHLFMDRLETLSDFESYKEPSESIVRKPVQEPLIQMGGGDPEEKKPAEKIPPYMPSTYAWEKIKKYVETQIQVAIHYKLVLNKDNTNSIQNGFKAVFFQSNCDSIDLESTKNEQMTEYFNTEYRALLNALCLNIPVSYAAPILSSYVLRNFTDLSDFLRTALSANASKIETYLLGAVNYNTTVSKVLEDKSIQPEYPDLQRIKKYPDNIGDLGSLDKVCEDRPADKGLDSNGVSEFLKVENITAERTLEDYVTPSILQPAFEVYKEEFNQCTENMEFLKNLFNMYSARSIKFMHHIRAQFEDDKTNDFIERYVITKHNYTMNIVTECIKHSTDIKVTLLNNLKKDVNETDQQETNDTLPRSLSYYTAYLIYLASDLDITVEKISKTPHIYFIKSRIDDFINQIKFPDDVDAKKINDSIISIIESIPDNESANYDRSLKNILVANKNSIMSRITRKILGKKSSKRKSISNKGVRFVDAVAKTADAAVSMVGNIPVPV